MVPGSSLYLSGPTLFPLPATTCTPARGCGLSGRKCGSGYEWKDGGEEQGRKSSVEDFKGLSTKM